MSFLVPIKLFSKKDFSERLKQTNNKQTAAFTKDFLDRAKAFDMANHNHSACRGYSWNCTGYTFKSYLFDKKQRVET